MAIWVYFSKWVYPNSMIIHENLYLLYMNAEVKRKFMSKPMILSKTPRKMSIYLNWAKLYSLD